MNNDYYNISSDLELQQGGYYWQKISFFEKEINDFKKRVKKDLLILDLACNDGKLSKIYSKYGKVIGIDLNEKAVKEACANGIEAICGDVLSLTSVLRNKEFDVVIAGDIIEHIFDTDLFLRVVYSVLNQGGMLLISTPNIVSLGRRIMSLFGTNPYCEHSASKNGINVGHIRYYTYSNLYEQLKSSGFLDIKIESDTLNLPLKCLDKITTRMFPKLGRELLAVCYKNENIIY